MKKTSWNDYCSFVVLISLGFLLYSQTLWFNYVWDDNYIFFENSLLREKGWSWNAIGKPIIHGTSYFRPLVMATWMMEYKLFRFDPFYSHLINLIFYIINILLVYKIATIIFEKYRKGKWNKIALCAAVFYAAHPCLVESVAWVSGRFDLFVTTFILAGCIVGMYPSSFLRLVLFAGFSLGALLSKELAVLMPFYLIIFKFSINRNISFLISIKEIKNYIIIFIIVIIFYFTLRKFSIGVTSYGNFNYFDIYNSIISGFWLRCLSFYFFISLFPFFDTYPQRDLIIELYSWRQSLIANCFVLLLFFSVFCLAIKKQIWAILLTGFLAAIFLVLQIIPIPIGEVIGAERFLSFPLVFFTFAVAEFLIQIQNKLIIIKRARISILFCFIIILIISIFSTFNYIKIWKSGLILWNYQYNITPNNRIAIVSFLLETSENKETHEIFEKVINEIREKNNDRLPGEIQLIYADYLFGKKDKESLLYYRGVIDNILEDGKIDRNRINYYSYLNYGKALIEFNSDFEKGYFYINKAHKLTESGIENKTIFLLVALDYIRGGVLSAKNAYNNNIKNYNEIDFIKINNEMKEVFFNYCFNKDSNNSKEQCDNYVKGIFEYFSEPE